MEKKLVLFVFRRNRRKWLEEWQKGEGGCEFLYGMPFINKEKYDVDFIEGDDSNPHWKRRICNPLENWMSRQTGIGFGLHIAWLNWEKIKKAVIIISTVDTCGLPIAMLKLRKQISARVIYISQ